jgi:hypothetical protein
MSKTKSVYAKDSSLQARNAKHQSLSQGKQGKNVKQINNGKKTSSIRPSLSIGTIAILVAGPYKGKRVVVVKHLDSGFYFFSLFVCLYVFSSFFSFTIISSFVMSFQMCIITFFS